MGNIKQEPFDKIWFGDAAQKVRQQVKTCPKNCWMVGTAAPVMKKYIKHPLKWVIRHKLASLLGKRIDRECLPDPFDVGQSAEQGNLCGGNQFSAPPEDRLPLSTATRLVTRVTRVKPMTDDSFLIRLEKGDLQFLPGQHVSIGPHLKYFKNRDYTFCSAPSDPFFEFLVKRVKKGEISPWLAGLAPGDIVELVGPYGDFTLRTEAGINHLFIATGVGIGPFKSLIKSHPDVDFKLIHGIRTRQHLCLADGVPRERYISCITREEGGTFKGRVTDYLKPYPISSQTQCYLCGNPYMLKQVKHILIDKGIPETRILIEPYYTY